MNLIGWKMKVNHMKCLTCEHTRTKEGAVILPIEPGNAILPVTDIPARVCANCGEPYLDEHTDSDIQELANKTLNGEISYAEAHANCKILVTPFA